MRSMRAVVAAAGMVILAWPAMRSSTHLSAQTRQRQLYVSALDERGMPVKNLTPDQLIIREDGVRREVLRVRRADAPMQIALVVDTSQAANDAIKDIRPSLEAFVEKMHERNEIALIAFGERPTVFVEYTHDLAQLKKGVYRVFAQPSSGAYFLEAIQDVSKGLSKREADRPVIVAIVQTEGPELSNQHSDDVLRVLGQSGAALHVLGLGTGGNLLNDEVRYRNTLMDRGSKTTGGRNDMLLTSMALRTKMIEIADELSNQFLVDYGRPDTLIPPEHLDVTTPQTGWTVRGTPVKTKAKAG